MTRRVIRLLTPKPAKKVGPPATPRASKWRDLLGEIPVATPGAVLPVGWNPNCISVFGKKNGKRFVWHEVDGQVWIWRLK